jgi:DNA-binding NtrC family response regulator
MKDKATILVRDPDSKRRAETREVLADTCDCELVDTVAEAHDALARQPVPAIVVREWAGISDGVPFCRAIHQRHPDIKIVLVAGDADHGRLIDAFNENRLFRCLIEPVAPEALTRAVRDAVRRFEMERVQNLLVERATEIDRTIRFMPYWLYRLRSALESLACLVAGSVGLCVVATLVLLLAVLGGFLLLYYLKTALGIDLFADRHLKDFISP